MRQPNKAIAEARAAGLMFFETGEPCRHGHVAPRYVSNWVCTVCMAEKHQQRAKDAERQAKVRERRAFAPGNYGGVPHHAPLCAPDLVTWGGPYPALMAAKWRDHG